MRSTRKRKHKKANKIKNRVMSLSRSKKLVMAAAIALMLIVISATISSCFFDYRGLGRQREIPANEYQYDTGLTSSENGHLYYEDEKYVSLFGIDVSEYQKEIDWARVSDEGVDFAMIRLGYRGYLDGTLQLDARYKDNIKEARKAGLAVGVYFVSQATDADEAIEEAKFVLEHIRSKHITCPVAFDMEPVAEGDKISKLTVEEKTEIADAFCEIIEKNGYVPVIYGNPKWLGGSIDLTYLTKRNIWLAHYIEQTDYRYSHIMWQYTDKGRIGGISTNVDLNLMMVEKSKYPEL